MPVGFLWLHKSSKAFSEHLTDPVLLFLLHLSQKYWKSLKRIPSIRDSDEAAGLHLIFHLLSSLHSLKLWISGLIVFAAELLSVFSKSNIIIIKWNSCGLKSDCGSMKSTERKDNVQSKMLCFVLNQENILDHRVTHLCRDLLI